MRERQLTLQQLDRRFKIWRRSTRQLFPPKAGWIRLIRQTLGMTTAQLAERLGVHRSRVIVIEQAEFWLSKQHFDFSTLLDALYIKNIHYRMFNKREFDIRKHFTY